VFFGNISVSITGEDDSDISIYLSPHKDSSDSHFAYAAIFSSDE